MCRDRSQCPDEFLTPEEMDELRQRAGEFMNRMIERFKEHDRREADKAAAKK